jgi:hypothetical protein
MDAAVAHHAAVQDAARAALVALESAALSLVIKALLAAL